MTGELPFFPGKVGLQQRVLPAYRVPFFQRLGAACTGGLSLYAGEPRNEEAILVARRVEGVEFASGRNVHLLSGSFYLCLQPGVIGWLSHWDPDVLVLEANPRYLSNYAAARWMHRRGRPVIGWGLGASTGRGWKHALTGWWRGPFLSMFDAILAYSSAGAEQYRTLGFPAERVFIAFNAVSPPPPAEPRARWEEEHGRHVLFVGRLQARKRVDLLIRACAQVNRDVHLWVVGDGPERNSLESLARQVYAKARFLGVQSGPSLRELYLQADLFVLPGTGGLAVQEAMAHGLPVIVAEGDGTQRDLVQSSNGWLVAPDDLPALAEALSEALADMPRLRPMGEASHRLVVERFNIDAMAGSFIDALRAVTGRGSP